MVYAEWQLLRQLQMASAWTDEPTVALPQVPENWAAAAEQRLDPGLVEPSQAEKTRYAQTDAAQAQPGQLLQALEQGRYQMSAAAVTFMRRKQAVSTAGPDGASNPRAWAAPRWPESAEPWMGQSPALTRPPAGSMQAVSRYFERDARRYG